MTCARATRRSPPAAAGKAARTSHSANRVRGNCIRHPTWRTTCPRQASTSANIAHQLRFVGNAPALPAPRAPRPRLSSRKLRQPIRNSGAKRSRRAEWGGAAARRRSALARSPPIAASRAVRSAAVSDGRSPKNAPSLGPGIATGRVHATARGSDHSASGGRGAAAPAGQRTHRSARPSQPEAHTQWLAERSQRVECPAT
jgi:hypothetical protein